MTTTPYTYLDAQGHKLTVRRRLDATDAPRIAFEAENTAIGGALTNAWLPVDDAARLIECLENQHGYGFTDHMGDSVSVIPGDIWTTVRVTRAARPADDNEPAQAVPVVILTARVPELVIALLDLIGTPEPVDPKPPVQPLATITISRHDEDPEQITVQANARGIAKTQVAYALRKVADQFDRDGQAAGETAIPYASTATRPAALDQLFDAIADALPKCPENCACRSFGPDEEIGFALDEPAQPTVPKVGDRYRSKNVDRTVKVTSVWLANEGTDDEHTAVAYEWRDLKPGLSGSACPLDVFLREYEPETAPGVEQPGAFTPDELREIAETETQAAADQ
ncbi:hypothetical protein ACWENS_05490 [Streptomyces sp. NPDC004532]